MITHPYVLHVAEPPAVYLARPPLVVDCSVLTALLFEEETRDQAYAAVGGKTLHAPQLLETEFVSVTLKKVRAGLPAERGREFLLDFDAQTIELHRVDMAMQFELAARYRLSAYDAAYLCVAAELRAPLATFDEKLAAAARAHLAELH